MPDQVEFDQGIVLMSRATDQRRDQGNADDEQRNGGGGREASRLGPHNREHNCCNTGRSQRHAEQVNTTGCGRILGLGQQLRSNRQHDETERHVDEKSLAMATRR